MIVKHHPLYVFVSSVLAAWPFHLNVIYLIKLSEGYKLQNYSLSNSLNFCAFEAN